MPHRPPRAVNTITGGSPLNTAANLGKDRCLALFLADDRVDVCRASADGQTPLLSACMQIMKSIDQVGAVGGNDPARCFVLMLKSRRLPKHNVEETIKFMGKHMPSRRQIDNAEAGGEPLSSQQKLCRIVLPVHAASSSPCAMPHRPPRASCSSRGALPTTS